MSVPDPVGGREAEIEAVRVSVESARTLLERQMTRPGSLRTQRLKMALAELDDAIAALDAVRSSGSAAQPEHLRLGPRVEPIDQATVDAAVEAFLTKHSAGEPDAQGRTGLHRDVAAALGAAVRSSGSAAQNHEAALEAAADVLYRRLRADYSEASCERLAGQAVAVYLAARSPQDEDHEQKGSHDR